MYFWENNLARAQKWAKEKESRGEIRKAAVLGAVLSLDRCFDLIDSKFTELLSTYYGSLNANYQTLGLQLPQNRDIQKDVFKDKILRELDCTVIEYMHQEIRKAREKDPEIQPFDSVRGLFTEGGPAFPGAGVQLKNHIQICIRNQNCIKGFFMPRKEILFIG